MLLEFISRDSTALVVPEREKKKLPQKSKYSLFIEVIKQSGEKRTLNGSLPLSLSLTRADIKEDVILTGKQHLYQNKNKKTKGVQRIATAVGWGPHVGCWNVPGDYRGSHKHLDPLRAGFPGARGAGSGASSAPVRYKYG